MMVKKKIGILVVVGVVLAALVAAMQVFSADEKDVSANVDETLSVAQAESLIEAGEDLETIPKSVWQQLLSEDEYEILWEAGTERAFTGDLLKNEQEGVYVTAGCRLPVFHSEHKFESGTGWPSFWEVFDKDNIVLKDDSSWGIRRTEVLSRCGEHLGHVFEDGPEPTGLRYCINSLALDFVPANKLGD